EVVKRIAGRRVCRNDSAHVFHVTYTPPKKDADAAVCPRLGPCPDHRAPSDAPTAPSSGAR
ncbi:hypothetical protein ACWDVX_36005, partial [Streptomyces tendae]